MSKSQITLIVIAAVATCGLCFLGGYNCGRIFAPPKDDSLKTVMVPIDGKMVELPADSEIIIECDDKEELYTLVEKIRESANSQGAALQQSGSELSSDWESKAPETRLAHGTYAKGGGLKGKFDALSRISVTTILAGAGALALIAGAGLFFTGRRMLGIGIAAGGGLILIAAFIFEQYPWLVLVIALLGLAGVVYLIYRSGWFKRLEKEHSEDQLALRAVTQGVANVNGTTGEEVKVEIGKAADALGAKDVVKSRVRKSLNGG